MLAKFGVENYKSFSEAVELNLISSSKIRDKQEHRSVIRTNASLLKYGAIYGANAAGKSNLISALSFVVDTVRYGLKPDCSRLYCRNRKENRDRDSLFELQFEIDDRFYAYGFAARLCDARTTHEWLYELKTNGEAKTIFERFAGGKPSLGSSLKLTAEEKNRFDTYASDFRENEKDMFLTEMNRGKRIDESSSLQIFRKIYSYITKKIVIITPSSPVMNFQRYYDSRSIIEMSSLIQCFDTGVTDVVIEKIDMGELRRKIPEDVLREMLRELRERQDRTGTSVARVSGRTDNAFFSIDINENSEPVITTVRFRHGSSDSLFDFEEESQGTIRLFDYLDMLLKNEDEVVYLVDELECSMHPMLLEIFLKLFFKHNEEKRVQLIFTTHEVPLMDNDLFRRDEIWFVERNSENNSTIFPLDRFRERCDRKLGKAYLEGRYGAVPMIRKYELLEGF